jgi:group I intron endonuclease
MLCLSGRGTICIIKNMIGIYKITNPKGRIYIGQSTNIEYRKKWYGRMYGDKQPKLYRSIKKHGWENHIFETIEECCVSQLNERETYWKIYYLNLVKNNYSKVLFCNLYDSGGGPLSKETKRKMSEARIGYKDSEETKLKKSNSFKGRKGSDTQKKAVSEWWNKNPERSLEFCIELGRKKSINSKPSPSQQRKHPRLVCKSNKPVYQLDIHHTIINSFISIAEASRITGVRGDSISACCRGVQKSSGGFIWKYKEI